MCVYRRERKKWQEMCIIQWIVQDCHLLDSIHKWLFFFLLEKCPCLPKSIYYLWCFLVICPIFYYSYLGSVSNTIILLQLLGIHFMYTKIFLDNIIRFKISSKCSHLCVSDTTKANLPLLPPKIEHTAMGTYIW